VENEGQVSPRLIDVCLHTFRIHREDFIMKVIECVEAYKEHGDDLEFDHFSIILAKGTKIFRAHSARAYVLYQDIDIRDLDCPLVPFPPEDLWPPFTNDFTHAPHPIPDNAFAKRPTFFNYHPETSAFKPRELLLHEAHICELLRRHPHKNIASYLGCINDGGFITGLCSVKYEETLSDRLRDSSRPLNPYSCLMGVKEALDHLHSLGLNHNDINPSNIMLDKQDVPIVIDFDSCQWEGEFLYSTGTPGWTDGTSYTSSERKNDDFVLKQLSKYLSQNTLVGHDWRDT